MKKPATPFKAKTALKCKHCGKIVFSKWSGHFAGHTCDSAGLISHKYDHDLKKEVPAVPQIAIDETEYYCRILGHEDDFEVVDL